MTSPPLAVAVLGGGVLGVSTAAHLAERGVAVTLVSDGPLGGGASGRSLAWLNSSARRSPAYHALRSEGLDRYRALAAAAGVPWLRFDGGLLWGGHAREVAAHHREVGYPQRWLDRAAVAATVPGVDPAAVPDEGALFNPDEGWVDLPSLIGYLARRLERAGGRVLADAGPATPVVRGGRATGLALADGSTVPADAVVVAAGAATPAVLAGLGVPVPDGSTAGFLVTTTPVDAGLRAVVNAPRVSVRPTPDGRLAVGAGWAEEAVTGRRDVPDGLAEAVLAEASAVLAGRPALRAAAVRAGRKPVPVDDEPVLGPVPGVAGGHVVFTHSGATLALVVGERVAGEVASGAADPLLAPFRADRFPAVRPGPRPRP